MQPLNSILHRCLNLYALVSAVVLSMAAHGAQLPDPTVTASCRAFSATYAATNLFAPYLNWPPPDFASKSQGPVSTPFTTNPNDGTWVEMDFGQTVTFDRFILRTRLNTVDVVQESRLIISSNPTFDSADTILTFNPSGVNGSGLIHNFPAVTGRYVRWEVTKGSATGNLGGLHMWFMQTPSGQSLLAAPTVIGAYTRYNSDYDPAYAVNGDAGSGAAGLEYASLGGRDATYIDFDFGASKDISGFDFWNRPGDVITAFDLIFSDDPGFGTELARKSFLSATNGYQVSSAIFTAVKARYLRLQATAASGYANTGASEIEFYTPGLRPPEITRQPQGGSLFTGEKFTLSVQAVGALPLHYQWFKGTAPIPGADSPLYDLLNAQVTDSADYTVVITNVAGSLTSSVAQVTVKAITSLTSGLAAYWPFNETSGSTAADASGQGSPGTVINFVGDAGQWTSGQVGGALRFRGAEGMDYVIVPTWPRALNGTMSVAAWVWSDTLPDRARIVCGGSGLDGVGQFLFTQSTGNNALRGYVEDPNLVQYSAQEGVPFPTNSWQHAVLVADGTTLRVYRNGTQVAAAPYSGALVNPTNALSIGARLTADDTTIESGSWQGKIDDVAYWTRALSAGEIAALYFAGLDSKAVPFADGYTNAGPRFGTQPVGGTYTAGIPVTLSVSVISPQPSMFQWKRDGVSLPGATNATLVLAAVQPGDAGSYTVAATSSGITTNSQPAVLTVLNPAMDITSGLVLHLAFDETSGTTAYDSSGLGNDASLLNFPEGRNPWVQGAIGNAIEMNTQPNESGLYDDQVLTINPVVLTNSDQFSFSFWCKSEFGGGVSPINPRFISPWQVTHWILWRGNVGVGIWDNVPVTPQPDSQWHHYVVVYDRAAQSYTVAADGAVVAYNVAVTDQKAAPGDVQWSVGYPESVKSYVGDEWHGMLDDVRLYNRLLNPIDAQALYALGVPPAVSLTVTRAGASLVIQWPAEVTGYLLEASSDLVSGTWTNVPGVVNNSVTVTPSAKGLFYRLKK